jgi:hypothetical protein
MCLITLERLRKALLYDFTKVSKANINNRRNLILQILQNQEKKQCLKLSEKDGVYRFV